MTRETKIGLIISGSFLCLVGIVVASKMQLPDAPPPEVNNEKIASNGGGEPKKSNDPPKSEVAPTPQTPPAPPARDNVLPIMPTRAEPTPAPSLNSTPPPLALNSQMTSDEKLRADLQRQSELAKSSGLPPLPTDPTVVPAALPKPQEADKNPVVPPGPTEVATGGAMPAFTPLEGGNKTPALPEAVSPAPTKNPADVVGRVDTGNPSNPVQTGSLGTMPPPPPAPAKGEGIPSPIVNAQLPGPGEKTVGGPTTNPDSPPPFPTQPVKTASKDAVVTPAIVPQPIAKGMPEPPALPNDPLRTDPPKVDRKDGLKDTSKASAFVVPTAPGLAPIIPAPGPNNSLPFPPPAQQPVAPPPEPLPTIVGNNTNTMPPVVTLPGPGTRPNAAIISDPPPSGPIPRIPADHQGSRPTPVVAKETRPEYYTCQSGETNFAQLSTRFYGTDKYADALAAYNRNNRLGLPNNGAGIDRSSLSPGQVVWKPELNWLESDYRQLVRGMEPNPIAPAITTISPVKLSSPTPLTVPNPGQGLIPVQNAPTPGQGRNYVVQNPRGESILDIAERLLGDRSRWHEIYRLNPNYPPQAPIPAGTNLVLPVS